MKATIVTVLALACPAIAWSNADPPSEPQVAPEPADGSVTGTGRLREARVFIREGRLEIRTSAGWTRVAIDTDWENAIESIRPST